MVKKVIPFFVFSNRECSGKPKLLLQVSKLTNDLPLTITVKKFGPRYRCKKEKENFPWRHWNINSQIAEWSDVVKYWCFISAFKIFLINCCWENYTTSVHRSRWKWTDLGKPSLGHPMKKNSKLFFIIINSFILLKSF